MVAAVWVAVRKQYTSAAHAVPEVVVNESGALAAAGLRGYSALSRDYKPDLFPGLLRDAFLMCTPETASSLTLAAATDCVDYAAKAKRTADVAAALSDGTAQSLIKLLGSSLPAIRMGAARVLHACACAEAPLVAGSETILVRPPLPGRCTCLRGHSDSSTVLTHLGGLLLCRLRWLPSTKPRRRLHVAAKPA